MHGPISLTLLRILCPLYLTVLCSLCSCSLMESFVPLGGFFSSPCELKGQFSGSYQFTSRCHQCNEKCEQEVAALSKGGFSASVADHHQPNLPSWLQMAELAKNMAFDVTKVCISFEFISETSLYLYPYQNSRELHACQFECKQLLCCLFAHLELL